jgi:hypothetical protein
MVAMAKNLNRRTYPASVLKSDMNKRCRNTKDVKSFSLCTRCEYRAKFIEDGHGPRYECSTGHCYSCYQYRPTIPYILEKNKDDDRPMFAPFMISARSHAVGVAKIDDHVNAKTIKVGKGQYVTTWMPSKCMALSQDQIKALSSQQIAALVNIAANAASTDMKKSGKKPASYIKLKLI